MLALVSMGSCVGVNEPVFQTKNSIGATPAPWNASLDDGEVGGRKIYDLSGILKTGVKKKG